MSSETLPPHWSWVKLGDVAQIKGGKRLPKGKTYSIQKTRYPYLRVVDFDNMSIDETDLRYLDKETQETIKAYIISSNDLYISIAGSIGKVGKIPANLVGANLTENAAKITEIKNLDLDFLKLYLNSQPAQEQIKKNTIATTQPKLALFRIEKITIPLPPLPEQKKIVEKIEELFSGLDSGVASLKKAKEQFRLYRQSVLAAAFSGRLLGKDDIFQKQNSGLKDVIFSRKAAEPNVEYKNNGLPEGIPDDALAKAGWKWVKLGVATQLNPKLPFEEIDENILVSFLPMRQVEELTGKFDLSMEKKYSEVKKGFTPFTNGDVIFAKITPCMENGKIAIVNKLKNKIGFGSTEFHVFRVKADLVNLYLFYFLIQDTFRAKAQHNMTGAVGQKRVPKRFLEESEIPLPPLDQQHKIVSEIEKRFSEADNLEKAIDDSLEKADRLRQSILKQAFEGKLV